MEQFLTADNNEVDAVLSENDGMAGGVVAALEAQGLAGQVPVSGQDGDQAALNRVALGTQTVDVWKDARELGKAAGEAAVALCAEPGRHRRSPAPRRSRRRVATTSRRSCSTPIPITQDNLDVVLDAGWIDEDDALPGRGGRLGRGLPLTADHAATCTTCPASARSGRGRVRSRQTRAVTRRRDDG